MLLSMLHIGIVKPLERVARSRVQTAMTGVFLIWDILGFILKNAVEVPSVWRRDI